MRLLAIILNWALVVVFIAYFRIADLDGAPLWLWALIALVFACPVVNLIALAATPPGRLSLYFARKAEEIRKLGEEPQLEAEEGKTAQEPEQD